MHGIFTSVFALWFDLEWLTQEDNITIVGGNINAGDGFIEFTVGLLGVIFGFAVGNLNAIEEHAESNIQ